MATTGCMVPPPGLEATVTATAAGPSPAHAGPWAGAVLAAYRDLGAEGLRRALAIVDRAIGNARHAQALDELISASEPSGQPPAPFLRSAACLRAQIGGEQLQLLGELQRLHARYSKPAGNRPAGTPAATAAARSAAPLRGPAATPALAQPTAQAPSAWTPNACPAAVKKSERPGPNPQLKQGQALYAVLEALSRKDPDRLFVVRHIHKLGFKASQALKRHFSAHGRVLHVLVAPSTARQGGNPECPTRPRPSNMGFVQMATREAVAAILAAGPNQEVGGAAIRVHKFEPEPPQATQTGEDEQVACARWDFERHSSSASDGSTVSTATGVSEDSRASEASSVDVPAAEAAESD